MATARTPAVTWQRVAVVGLIGLLVVGLLLTQIFPQPEPRPPPGAVPMTPIVVSVNRDGAGSAHVGYPISLTAAAIGQTGIAGMELWVGGTLVEAAATADPQRPAATMRWAWTPEEAGETILVARAYDSEGRTGQSSAVRLTVDNDAPRSWQVVDVSAAAGETVASVVAAHGGDLTAAAVFNSDVGLDDPLAADTVVVVPILEQGPAGGTATVPRAALASTRSLLAAALPSGLVTPVPIVEVEGCTLQVTAPDTSTAEAGYELGVLPPGATSFLALPPLSAADGGTVTGETLALGGMNYVTLSAYSDGVSAPSAIVPVVVPDACTDGWEGDARLDGTELVLSAPVDLAYFYLKVGDQPWERVPADAGAFITPVGGTFDAAGLLPPVGGEPLRLEAWGWDDGALVSRGEGAYTPPAEPYGGTWGIAGQGALGNGTGLDIVLHADSQEFPEELTKSSTIERPGTSSTTRTFKWSTNVVGATHLVWQILPYPLAGDPTLTPPFLVDSSTFAINGQTSGYFTIDFEPYLTAASGVASAPSWAEAQLLGQIVGLPGAPAPTPSPGAIPNVVTVGVGGPFVPPSDVGAGEAALNDLAMLAPPLSTIYVRVIPMKGTVPAGPASNSVALEIVEPGDPFYIDQSPPPPPPQFDETHVLTSAVFFAPTGSIAKYVKCVRVVVPPPTPPPLGGDWGVGTVHCHVDPDDDFDLADAFESFVEWVATAWDYISEAYDWIQDQIVDLVLALVPCEDIANEVADNGKETCKVLAKTALQAVAVAYGVPPEIPKWDGVIAGLKGDLRTFILANASQLSPVGDACDAADVANGVDDSFPTCGELVDELIDESVDYIMDERSAAAEQVSGVYAWGATVELDPRGRAQPPHFAVTVTRTNAPLPAGTVCTMRGEMASEVAAWTWKEYEFSDGVAHTVQHSGPVSGEPFNDNTIELPSLAPGESYTFELWLTKPTTWFEPDGWNDHGAEQYANWNGVTNRAWVLLQKGAVVTGSLSSNCVADGSATETLTGSAAD